MQGVFSCCLIIYDNCEQKACQKGSLERVCFFFYSRSASTLFFIRDSRFHPGIFFSSNRRIFLVGRDFCSKKYLQSCRIFLKATFQYNFADGSYRQVHFFGYFPVSEECGRRRYRPFYRFFSYFGGGQGGRRRPFCHRERGGPMLCRFPELPSRVSYPDVTDIVDLYDRECSGKTLFCSFSVRSVALILP